MGKRILIDWFDITTFKLFYTQTVLYKLTSPINEKDFIRLKISLALNIF